MLKVATRLGRAFGGLKVRYKLMVLHNLFFLVLAGGVHVALMPVIEQWAAEAQAREARIAEQGVGAAHAETSAQFYEYIVQRTRINIYAVLFATYWLGVLILEGLVMRLYIYKPLKTLLDADEASRRRDTERELIDESLIQGDELGRLMSSRNATLQKLRLREQDLEQTLLRLEEAAADLRQKNYLLATAKQNIADQDRLASLGMLAAGLAHEVNTPLTVLQGSIEQMAESASDPATKERLGRMLRVTGRMHRMSTNMLDFARVRNQEHKPVPLRPVIEEAWNLITIDAKAGQVTFTSRVNGPDMVLGNSDRLVQLFLNLLRNALQAVEEGGRIEVSATPRRDRGRGYLAVRVEDDGPGIPADVLPGVFEAFVTSRLDARGTGLGLTVAEGIAHQHGGLIVASNRPAGGACLEVRLPTPEPEDSPPS